VRVDESVPNFFSKQRIMKLENYPNCLGCGKANIAGKNGLCLGCYCGRGKEDRIVQLRDKIRTAESWLKEKHDPDKFDEGMARYEALLEELALLEA